MVKSQYEKNIETQYICEQCGTVHIHHRLTMGNDTVIRGLRWGGRSIAGDAADRTRNYESSHFTLGRMRNFRRRDECEKRFWNDTRGI
jgi:hypothetical protein